MKQLTNQESSKLSAKIESQKQELIPLVRKSENKIFEFAIEHFIKTTANDKYLSLRINEMVGFSLNKHKLRFESILHSIHTNVDHMEFLDKKI